MIQEKVLLVIIDFKRNGDWSKEDITQELEELVVACHGKVIDKIFCRIDRPSPAYLIGTGKVNEITSFCSFHPVDTVVFSRDLKSNQQRNLEEVIKVKTIDRTQLILDIFAHRAASLEGKMQVELAQLEYLIPRLVGQGIYLSRLGGGIGTVGPGETKLEVDRRRIAERIAKLKKGLKEVAYDRSLKRKKRREEGLAMISLVGYTNAGKSTLLNTLTHANQLTQDGLFTTLDPLSRQLVLPSHQKVILSDTVGFMHDLPLHLIEAFKATLEEVTESDLLLHILDVSHPQFLKKRESVLEVLKELKAEDKPMITVLNKIDQLEDKSRLEGIYPIAENPVAISAKTQENIPQLLDKISDMISTLFITIDCVIPINRMDLISLAHTQGQVYSVKYYNDTIHIRASLPAKVAGQFYKVSQPFDSPSA